MFRLDGEVFLFGTAIAAPLIAIKIATICALSQRDNPPRRPDRRELAPLYRLEPQLQGRGGGARTGRGEGPPMASVPVTLATVAAVVFVNIWLGSRIAAYRRQFKVSVGDGGHEPFLRRMRAQANFIE